MPKTRIDRLSRKILRALQVEPRADAETIAAKVGAEPDVVRDRITRLETDGVLQGFSVRVDAVKMGFPMEFLVTGSPSVETTKDALKALCHHQGVTRVFTLATQDSVAFTISGSDIKETEARAQLLARQAGLEHAQCTMIVQTLVDNPTAFLNDGPQAITQ